jgi:putative two-component system response regulator
MDKIKRRILIVDDEPCNLRVMQQILSDEYQTSFATNGVQALEAMKTEPDLILLDIMMPEMDGYEVCRRLKQEMKTKDIPVLFVTAMGDVEDETKGLQQGAIDYITKPVSPAIVRARVKNHMDLKQHRDHLDNLVQERTSQLRDSYVDTVQRLTLASEYKDEETGAHIKRISYYTREIAQRIGMDSEFCETIFFASPMHDIGKVSIPDAILLKQGPLDDEEWKIMKSHSTVGANILENSQSPILLMAVDIARSHHERMDGKGYPAGLKGDDIPLTARIMNIADQYDALRSKRPYKPGFDPKKTLSIITEGDGRTMPEHFDPEILDAFKKAADVFNDIFETHKDD